MIYAKATMGPLEQPYGIRLVEILMQKEGPPYGHFKCRDLETDKEMVLEASHLKLVYHQAKGE